MDKYDKKAIGNRISARLDFIGQTPAWLAKEMGVSRQAVSEWIDGKTAPRGSRLHKLCNLLGRSESYLLFGVETVEAITEQGAHIAVMWQKLPEARQVIAATLMEDWLRGTDVAEHGGKTRKGRKVIITHPTPETDQRKTQRRVKQIAVTHDRRKTERRKQ